MPKRQVELGQLGEMAGGFLKHALPLALEQVGRDLAGRPAVSSARKVLIEFSFKPTVNQSGVCSECKMGVGLKTLIPNQRVEVNSVGVAGNGQMMFRPDSEEDVNQMTLADERDEKGGGR